MAEIPDGVDANTAYIAVAWKISQTAYDQDPHGNFNGEKIVDEYTRLFRKAFKQLLSTPEEKG